jgi:transcriptional regulator with XRE-family HTH domain
VAWFRVTAEVDLLEVFYFGGRLMQDVKKLVGERVRTLRKRRNFSQEVLASKVGIDMKSLSRLERGAHYPSLDTLEKIQVELAVELKDFFDFEKTPSADELRDFLIRSANDADYATLQRMSGAVRSVLSG